MKDVNITWPEQPSSVGFTHKGCSLRGMLENPERSGTKRNGTELEPKVIDAQYAHRRWTRSQKLKQFVFVYGLLRYVLHVTATKTGQALVSQAIPFAERGRVWSRCNYRVVAEERNYRPLRLGNKTLTSAKQVVT